MFNTGKYDSIIAKTKEKEFIERYSNSEISALLAECYRNNFDYSNALFYYNSVIEDTIANEVDRITAYVGLTFLHVELRNLSAAKETLSIAEKLLESSKIEKLIPHYQLAKSVILIFDGNPHVKDLLIECIKKLSDEDPAIITAYLWLSDIFIEEHDYNNAEIYLFKGKEKLDQYFGDNEKLKTTFSLTYAYFLTKTGNYSKSLDILKSEVYDKTSELEGTWAQFMLAEYYRYSTWPLMSLGKYVQVIDYYRNYLTLIDGILDENHTRYAEVYSSLSNIYYFLGYHSLAISYNQQAKEIFEYQGSFFNVLGSYYNSCKISYYNGEYLKSIEYAQKITEISNTSELQKYYSDLAKMFSARSYFALGQFEKSLNDIEIYYKSMIEYKGRGYDRLMVAGALQIDILNELDENDKAAELFREIYLQIRDEKSYCKYSNQSFYNKVSEILIKNGKLDSAQYLLEDIITNCTLGTSKSNFNENFSNNYNVILSRYLSGLIKYKKFRSGSELSYLKDANNDFNRVLELMKNTNYNFKPENDRITYQTKSKEIIDHCFITNFLLFKNESNNEYLEKLFIANEVSKSSYLLEAINRNSAIKSTKIPDTLLLKVSSLKQQASYLSTQIKRLEGTKHLLNTDSAKLLGFKRELLDNQVSFTNQMLYLEQHFPNYYELNYNPNIVTIKNVQNRLSNGQVLIEYHLDDNDVYAICISQDTAVVHQLPQLTNEMINNFRNSINRNGTESDYKNYETYTSQAYQLYLNLLAKPLSSFETESIKKLYIIPDKALNYLPFELLIDQSVTKNEAIDYQKLPYLIKGYDISYGYSSSILFREDPISKDQSTNGKVLAVAPSYDKLLKDTTQMKKFGKFRNSISALQYNLSEVEGIGKYFDATILKAETATERSFLENLKGHDILHLAMHGFVDVEKPEYSRLVFAQENDSVSDNFLHNFELYNLTIDSKMAVLSACNTGFGKLEGTEGVLSLARAFTYAGVPSVVMSHWPADDETSSFIMQSFYKYLSEGKQKDHALRLAKLEFLQQASLVKQNPFYWNNFVVMGDVSPIEKNNGSFIFKISIVITTAILFILAFIYFRKKRKSELFS